MEAEEIDAGERVVRQVRKDWSELRRDWSKGVVR
jgi:hypothetical protein